MAWHGQTVYALLDVPINEPVNLWLAPGLQQLGGRAAEHRGRAAPPWRKRLGVVYEGSGGRSWVFGTDDPERQDPGPILCVPPKGGTELLVYNGWLDDQGAPEERRASLAAALQPWPSGRPPPDLRRPRRGGAYESADADAGAAREALAAAAPAKD